MRITLAHAVELIRGGDVVAIPTDTVYGLAVDMHNRSAIDKIFHIKKRPNNKPLITLVSALSEVSSFVQSFPPGAELLAQHFWPGALTLVMPVEQDKVLDNIRSGMPSAGFRVPEHPITLDLLKQSGPLIATSANRTGYPSAISPELIEQEFGSAFPILDGGRCVKGIESTVLAYRNGKWCVLRLGAVTPDQLEAVLGYPLS